MRASRCLRCLAVALAASGCRPTPPAAVAGPPTNAALDLPPGATPSSPSSPSPDVPRVSLGATLEPRPFTAGRYATAIQRTLQGTHALQRLVERSTVSFVLELAPGGSATACRGWCYAFTNDGPAIQTAEALREQQGYRGHVTVSAGIASVELVSDDTVCPSIRDAAFPIHHAPSLTLRCLGVRLTGAPAAAHVGVEPGITALPVTGPLRFDAWDHPF